DLDATRQTWFLSVQGDGAPTTHPPEEGLTVVGRAATAHLRHPAADASGRPAAVLLDHDGVRIEDLRSTNGTYVNGERVRSRRLAPGDVVRLGSAVLRIDTPQTLGTLSSPTAFSIGRQDADAIWNVGGNVHQSS